VLELVGIHLHTRLSAGGLISMWHRLGDEKELNADAAPLVAMKYILRIEKQLRKLSKPPS